MRDSAPTAKHVWRRGQRRRHHKLPVPQSCTTGNLLNTQGNSSELWFSEIVASLASGSTVDSRATAAIITQPLINKMSVLLLHRALSIACPWRWDCIYYDLRSETESCTWDFCIHLNTMQMKEHGGAVFVIVMSTGGRLRTCVAGCIEGSIGGPNHANQPKSVWWAGYTVAD